MQNYKIWFFLSTAFIWTKTLFSMTDPDQFNKKPNIPRLALPTRIKSESYVAASSPKETGKLSNNKTIRPKGKSNPATESIDPFSAW